jgi:hypothetical protein
MIFVEVTCDGIDIADHLDHSAARRGSQVAIQQKLGLWSNWRRGTSAGNRPDLASSEGRLDQENRLYHISRHHLTLVGFNLRGRLPGCRMGLHA